MLENLLSRILRRRIRPSRPLYENKDLQFLKNCNRLVHIGANSGQEREIYDRCELDVIWTEPIPTVYNMLLENIRPYPRQQAIRALLSDRADEDVTFHVSNNEGLSSSILPLAQHADIWPQVH